MSKYAPLANHLRHIAQSEVTLSFGEVEAILGFDLPPTANRHPRWWADSHTADSHTWAHQWIEAGWTAHKVDLSERWVTFRRTGKPAYLNFESHQAREGYEVDRQVLAPARNATIASERKRVDNYTCQTCGFHLEVQGSHVLEVHHLNPLSPKCDRLTTIGDLVSLCPTCHRIAHLRSPPYSPAEIKQLRETVE